MARGGTAARVRGRRPPSAVYASLEFPEAIANELTLRCRGSSTRRSRGPSGATTSFASSRRGSRTRLGRRTLTLRDPSGDAERIRVALAQQARRVRPSSSCASSSSSSPSRPGTSSSSSPPGARDRARLREGLRQVRASAGSGSSAPSWRSRHGLGFPSHERCWYRGTSSHPLQRSLCTRRARRGQPPSGALLGPREEWRVVDRWWTDRSCGATSRSSWRPARTPSSSTTAPAVAAGSPNEALRTSTDRARAAGTRCARTLPRPQSPPIALLSRLPRSRTHPAHRPVVTQ